MADMLRLRDTINDDLVVFYQQQLDPDASYMAAFTAKDPADRVAFFAHWHKIMADETVKIQTILFNGEIAGNVLSYEEEGRSEVSYWLGKEFWGKGIATQVLIIFLNQYNKIRPMYARVAKDNLASRRVLEKCGFVIIGESKGFANARGQEIDEFLLEYGE